MTTRAEILRVAEPLSLGVGPAALAVDVGGTGLKAGLVDGSGHFVDAATAVTPGPRANIAEAIVEAIADFRDGFCRKHGTDSIAEAAVVVPGIVDEATGTAIYSANLGWDQVPLQSTLRERLGLAVEVSHDVRSAGRAEFEFGADMPANAVMITIGTGVAGAIMVEGRLLTAGGYAGEVGFMEVAVDTADGGFRGPIEHIASAAAIARRYSQRSGAPVTGSVDVLAAMHGGNSIAANVFAEAVDALGAMCAQIVALIAPEAIVLGGGLSSADELVDGVEATLKARLGFQRMPSIRRAGLGPVAGVIGAGMLTRSPAR